MRRNETKSRKSVSRPIAVLLPHQGITPNRPINFAGTRLTYRKHGFSAFFSKSARARQPDEGVPTQPRVPAAVRRQRNEALYRYDLQNGRASFLKPPEFRLFSSTPGQLCRSYGKIGKNEHPNAPKLHRSPTSPRPENTRMPVTQRKHPGVAVPDPPTHTPTRSASEEIDRGSAASRTPTRSASAKNSG